MLRGQKKYMKSDTPFISFSLEQRMIHHLMLKSSSTEDMGLFYGKMGIAIFFFCYGQYKNNSVYTDMGEDLLDDIWEKLDSTIPMSFDVGLCGIGWGIEYLIQHRLVEGEANDICEAIDRKIVSIHPGRLEDLSLDTGLEGIRQYVSIRTSGAFLRKEICPFSQEYLNDWNQSLLSCTGSGKFSSLPCLRDFTGKKEILENEILIAPLGIRTGIAGILYNCLPLTFL